MAGGTVISALTKEASLKRRVRKHLKNLGFEKNSKGELLPQAGSKGAIRNLHSVQRSDLLLSNATFVEQHWGRLRNYFAAGTDVKPERISPRLEMVRSDTWQARLFRLAALTWSIPVSAGFGRRIRYLVWDESNGKLIGLIALGDPVFNQKARDDHIGWSANDRSDRLVNILDAYVLGAIPPYNSLLCGKLVACMIRSHEVRLDFWRKYGESTGIISGAEKHAKLVLVTTSSALGRSSVYNRLKLGGQQYFRDIGFTKGWGHFHIPDGLFYDLRTYLRDKDHRYVDGHEYGDGPNWRLRTIRAALVALGFKGNTLRHGVNREVFACHLADNVEDVLQGKKKRPDYSSLKSVDEVTQMALARWVLPRAARRTEYSKWEIDDLLDRLKMPPSTQVLPADSSFLAGGAS